MQLESQTQTYSPDADGLPGNDELFAGYAWRALYGESGIATLGEYGRSTLGDTDKEIYDQLKTAVTQVAAEGGSTTFDIDLTDIDITCEVTPGVDSGETLAAMIDADAILAALLSDCPYELYWFDKTEGISMDMGYSEDPTTGTATLASLSFDFYVAADYQDASVEEDGGDPLLCVDATDAQAAAKAASAAQAVVTENAGKTDYEKLLAYKTYICDAVSYNSDAASDTYTGGYGDPWQLIYVFDGDSATNVVCEGYAKAFQYLCDLTNFEDETAACYTVTGEMTGGTGAGKHMWNIVTLGGASYLVDVTNSDKETAGAYGGLFLAGAPSGTAAGYTITIPQHDLGDGSYTTETTITYAYDNDTTSLYGESILTLATADYTAPEPEPAYVASVTIDGETTQYTDIQAAFAAANSGTEANPATITLLDDVEVSKGGYITVSGTIMLEGGEHTICGTRVRSMHAQQGLIDIPSGGSLTVQSGTIQNEVSSSDQSHCITVSGGTLVVNGGAIKALSNGVNTAGTVGIYVTSGTVEVNAGSIYEEDLSTAGYGVWIAGGTFTMSGGCVEGTYAGLYVDKEAVTLSGGTFVCLQSQGNAIRGKAVGKLLAEGYAYYSGEEAEGTPSYGVNTTATELPAGTFTVGECVNHDWREGNYTCTYCNAQAAASVKIGEATTYYGAIEDAWAAAKKQTTGATVTLLDDVTVSEALTVDEGDNITLTSGTDTAGNTYTLSSLSYGYENVILVSDGKLNLTSGTVAARDGSFGTGIWIEGGSLSMTGGTIIGYRALYVNGGSADISGGNIRGDSSGYGLIVVEGSVTLTGGTFYGGSAAISSNKYTIKDFLKIGYAYKQGDSWVNDINVNKQTGTVTVAEAPIQSVSISPDTTTITYGDTAPTLTAEVKQPEGSTSSVTYRWYLNGTEITGATSAAYTPGKLGVGDYEYTCTTTAEGYSLTSDAATVKVEKKEVVLTFDGTTTKTYDGTAAGPTNLSIAIANAVSGDDVTVTAKSYTYNSANVKEANTITANNVTLSGNDAGNYKLPEGSITTSGTITKSTPVITFWDSAITITYSGKALSYLFRDYMTVDGASINDIVFSWKDASGNILDSAPVNAGTYDIIATIKETKNTNEATNSIKVYILTRTVSKPTITLDQDSYEYDGTAKEPTVKVFDGDTEIDPKEYTVTYSNNVEVGTNATVTITDAAGGNYEVNGSTTFEITKPDLATATVTLTLPDGTPVTDSTYTYDGTAKTPEITVVKNNVTVDPGEYTVSYSNTNGGDGNHTNAGTVTVTITAKENGNYSGSKSKTFEIKQADISGAVVTLSGTRFEYIGGTEIAVDSVILNSTKLILGTDYTYSGNIGKDVGTYTVTVEGKGNYTGTATAKWEIYEKELTVGSWTITKAYDGTADITLDTSDAVLYDVRYQDDVKLDASGVTAKFEDADAGDSRAITYTGTFTLTGTAAKNYVLKYQPTLTGSITQRPITVTPTAGQSKEYGTADPVALTYTTGEGQLLDGHTVTLARSDKSEAVGQYDIDTCTITDAAQKDVTANYDVTLKEATFEITKPSLESATVTLSQTSFTYTGQPQAPAVTVKKGTATVADTEYTVHYTGTSYDSDNAPTNAGTYTVTVTAVQDGNYTGSNAEATFTIGKATPAIGEVTLANPATLYPSTKLADVTLAREDTTVPGTLTLDAEDANATFGEAGEKTYNWTFTPTDTANYETATGSIELTVTEDTLTGISIGDTAPTKKNYIHGDTFEMGGLTVTATYASGLTADVTANVNVVDDTLTAGQKSVTLSYTKGDVTETCTVDGLTVAKKTLDVSGVKWSVGTYTYNGAEQGPTLEGEVPDGVEITLKDATATNAGTYTATATFTLAEGYSAEHYEITGTESGPLTAEWSIGKASPTVSVQVAGITGSGSVRTVTLQAELTSAGEDIPTGTVTFTAEGVTIGTAEVGADGAARYDWQADADMRYTVAAQYGGSRNYTEAASEAITVNTARQPQTIAIADVGAKAYGDAPFELALAAEGSGDGDVTFTSSDPDILSIEGSTATIHAAGTVTITAVKAADDTHDAAEATLELRIGQKALTVTADDVSMVVGDTVPELTYTVAGLVDGDTFTGPELTVDTDGSTTGSYTISITGGTLTHADSYAVEYVDGTLTVSAKPLYTVTVENGTGGGSYTEGETVTVTAAERLGSTFDCWTGDAEFADKKQPTTTFVMPAHDVTVTANYTQDSEEPLDPGFSDEEDEAAADHRLVKPAITDDQIPETLKEAGYATADEIEETLAEKLAEELRLKTDAIDADSAEEQMQFFDVRLEVKDENGSWVKVSQENFPKQGIRVWLADLVPDVDQATHSFVVTHMLVADMDGHSAGDVEYPDLMQGERGLYFTVYSLSPIGVAWTEKPAEQPAASGSDGDVEAFIGAAVVIGGGAALLAYHYREDLPIWKLAGVVTLAAADGTAAGAPVANATVTLYQDGEAVKTLTTDESGLFTARVPKGTYEAVVTWERDGAVYTARKEVVAESVLDDGAVQQIVLQAAEG